MRALLFALLALGCSQASWADVRVVSRPHGLGVDIRPVDGSAWTVRSARPPSVGVVNPNGTALGDGYPGIATDQSHAVLAWVRHATGELVVAAMDRAGQLDGPHALESGGAVGVPTVHRGDGGWLVIWQALTPSAHVRAVLFTPGTGVGDVVALQDGQLLDSVTLGAELVTITTTSGSAELVVSRLRLDRIQPLPNPIPGDTQVRIDILSPFRTLASSSEGPASVIPCIRTRDDEIIVAWPTGDGWHDRVTITADAVDGPVAVRAGNCSSALNSHGD